MISLACDLRLHLEKGRKQPLAPSSRSPTPSRDHRWRKSVQGLSTKVWVIIHFHPVTRKLETTAAEEGTTRQERVKSAPRSLEREELRQGEV